MPAANKNNPDSSQELQEIHTQHLAKLKSLHAFEVASLHSSLQAAQERGRQQDEEVEALREQVTVLRQSFEMVQERLKRVLLEQDQLVDMIKCLNIDSGNSPSGKQQQQQHLDADYKRIRTELAELEQIYGLAGRGGVEEDQTTDSPVSAAVPKHLLHCLKYLRKLQSADPVQLCRLLDLPFTAEKPFALADSLLHGILSYARAPDSDFSSGTEGRIARLLVYELIQSKRECYALVQRMIEEGVVGIDDFTQKASDESSCVRIALKGQSGGSDNNNNSSPLLSLFSKLL